MADLELLYFDQENNQSNYQKIKNYQHSDESCLSKQRRCDLGSLESVCEDSAPWTATRQTGQHSAIISQGKEDEPVYSDDELETTFTSNNDKGVPISLPQPSLRKTSESENGSLSHGSSSELHEVDVTEMFMLPDDDLISEDSGKSVDYGFISAVTCLVTGISLVAISYTVPRDVKVDSDNVSAREMERLEMENARVGTHLERCVIVGLCLLTLGGVLLSTLLMISMWKGEMIRRRVFAYSKHSAKLYGSINLRASTSPTRSSSHKSICEEDLEALGEI